MNSKSRERGSIDTASGRRTRNLLTVDLEDWYQLTGWVMQLPSEPRPDALERQTHRLLELLAKHGCRATFFCLGKSLSHCPHIVQAVADAGHEIASHGWNHERIYQLGIPSFQQDLSQSLDWLQSLIGKSVRGYRAPCFSVRADQLDEFLDICCQAGLDYDSSVYPFRGRLYGIPDSPIRPYVARTDGTKRLVEFPLLTTSWLGRRWPIAGGGWWRMLPGPIIDAAIRSRNQEGAPAVIYFHPYEFDNELLSVKKAVGPSLRSTIWTWHQNAGRQKLYHRLDQMLSKHHFGAIEDFVAEHF